MAVDTSSGVRSQQVGTYGAFDEIDDALLRALRENGRASYEELGQKIGLSGAAVRLRATKLFSTGQVRVVGVVHPRVLGLRHFAHLSIRTTGPARPVAEALVQHEEIPFVSLASGWTGVIAELRTRTMDGLMARAAGVRGLPHVLGVEATLYRTLLKDSGFLLSDAPAVSLDEVDQLLVKHLQTDGRASFADLSRVVGLSVTPTRARVLNLIDTGVLRIGVRGHPGTVGTQHHVGFGLSLRGSDEQILSEIAHTAEVHFLASSMGTFDAVGTVVSHSARAAVDVCESMRALDGVRELSTWSHFEYVKESHGATRIQVTGSHGS